MAEVNQCPNPECGAECYIDSNSAQDRWWYWCNCGYHSPRADSIAKAIALHNAIAPPYRSAQLIAQWCNGHGGMGWYYWNDEYPDEGSAGPFAAFAEMKANADSSGEPYELTVLNPGKGPNV